MSAIYGFASRLSGCMAGLCAILALLALPSPSRADTLSDCQACCREKGFVDQQLSECVGYCMQGSGPCSIASQCPGIEKNGVYQGCVAAGIVCQLPGKASTCGNSVNGKHCTCLP